ncbi:MAG: hypothetical protein NXY59_04670 [Aigarchaeota archaeon]|nr:hypothetical protein [Candidatus Pelearchaeum maunauluense]
MKIRRVDGELRRQIEHEANRTYGVSDFFSSYELIISGEGRVRATTPETLQLASILKKVDSIGLYVAKYRKWGLTLSIEGSHYLCQQLKNTLELDRDDAVRWMMAAPVEARQKTSGKFVVARYHGFCMGTGVMGRDGRAYPQVPKWRRIPEE